MSEKERNNLRLQWAQVAMTSDAGDPLKRGGGLDRVGCVGIECWASWNPGVGRARVGPSAGRVEERVEAACLDDGRTSSRIGKHVRCGGDDCVGARGSEFDPVGKVQTAGDEV